MKSRIEVVGKPKDKGRGRAVVQLSRSISEDGSVWQEVEVRYLLLHAQDVDTQEKTDALLEAQNSMGVELRSEPKKPDVDAPFLEGKTSDADTLEPLPVAEKHPEGPPDAEAETAAEALVK